MPTRQSAFITGARSAGISGLDRTVSLAGMAGPVPCLSGAGTSFVLLRAQHRRLVIRSCAQGKSNMLREGDSGAKSVAKATGELLEGQYPDLRKVISHS